MLASRGFAYLSEQSASEGHHGYHDNCDCVVVPGFQGPDGNPRVKIDGYDPETMYRNWLSCAKTVGVNKVGDPTQGWWTDDERRAVRREVATRDWHWLYTGEAPKWGKEGLAHPSGDEQDTAQYLAKGGFASLFRPTRSREKKTTSDVYFVSGSSKTPWEFKHPSGNGKSTVGNQFDEAAGQSRNLVIDGRDLGPYWTNEQLLKEATQKLNRRKGFKVERGQHKGEIWYYDHVLLILPDGSVRKLTRG
jgi:hypothetical protein